MSLSADAKREADLAAAEAFAVRFQAAYRRLMLVAAGISGSRDAAEDVVQEAALIAYTKLEQFDGVNFAAWTAEIVRRCALGVRRKTRTRRTYATDPTILGELNGLASAADERRPMSPVTGELLADQLAFDDRVLAALQDLSAEARCCLLLRTVEQLSYAEIAALMQMPEGTAMSHVHRSKHALRRRLGGVEHPVSPTGPPHPR